MKIDILMFHSLRQGSKGCVYVTSQMHSTQDCDGGARPMRQQGMLQLALAGGILRINISLISCPIPSLPVLLSSSLLSNHLL